MAIVREGSSRMDPSTKKRLDIARLKSGLALRVTQGGYNAGAVSESAGTHDGGGVIDISVKDMTWDQIWAALTALREAGFIAWYRNAGFKTPHIHAVERSSKTLSEGARKQVLAYNRGRNGLANNGADDGPKVDIPLGMPDEEEEDDMYTDEDRKRDQRTHDRVLALMAPVEQTRALIGGVAKMLPTTHRWVGYTMSAVGKAVPQIERQGAALDQITADLAAALADTQDPAQVEALTKALAEIESIAKGAQS